MEIFFSKIKTLADNLKLEGSPISISDLIIQTFVGMDIEYNAIVVTLSYKSDLTWIDMQIQLLAIENRLDRLNIFF